MTFSESDINVVDPVWFTQYVFTLWWNRCKKRENMNSHTLEKAPHIGFT